MALSRALLAEDEHELVRVHTHAKALLGPVVILLAVAAAAGLALGAMPAGWHPWGPWITVALSALLVVAGTIHPWLRWQATTCTVTDRRVIIRRGVLARTAHDIPLHRIRDIRYHRGLTDHMLGCGTLVLTTAAPTPVILPDVPSVKRVHARLSEAVLHAHRIHGDPTTTAELTDHEG